MSSPSSSSSENQKALLTKLIKAEEAWDLDFLVANRTSDARHQLLPKSVGTGPMSPQEFREYMSTLKAVFQDFKCDIRSVTNDAEAHKATVYMNSTASSAAGPFEMESIFFYTITEDGTKLTEVAEFVDSAYLAGFLKKVTEATSLSSS